LPSAGSCRVGIGYRITARQLASDALDFGQARTRARLGMTSRSGWRIDGAVDDLPITEARPANFV
jgi:hypothetical protein